MSGKIREKLYYPFMARREDSICVDLRTLQTNYAHRGVGRYTRQLVERIYQQHKGIASLVFGSRDNPYPEIPVLISAPEWKRPWLWDQLVLPCLLLKKQVGLFHNFAALGPLHEISFPACYAPRSFATVYDMHMFENHASDINRFYRNTMRIKVQKWGLPRADRCIVISHKTAADVAAMVSLDRSRIVEVSLGCDHMDAFTGDIKNPIGERQDPYILTIGDTPNKNPGLCYRIIQRLRQDSPELRWVSCGDGERIRKLASIDDNDSEWIEFRQNVEDQTLALLYSRARLLLFPSREEGFGIPVIEAMRLGCPVVAGNVEPVRSSLGYDSGLDPTDDSAESFEKWHGACKQILIEERYRQDMIEQGRKRSESFTWDASAERILQLYQEYFSCH